MSDKFISSPELGLDQLQDKELADFVERSIRSKQQSTTVAAANAAPPFMERAIEKAVAVATAPVRGLGALAIGIFKRFDDMDGYFTKEKVS